MKKLITAAVVSAVMLSAHAFDSYKDAIAAGLQETKAKKWSEAEQAYASAVDLSKNVAEKASALYCVGESQRQNNKMEEASKTYVAILALPDVSDYYKNMAQLRVGQTLMWTKKYDQAITELEKVFTMKAPFFFIDAQQSIGNCLRMQKKYDEMGKAYEKVLKMEKLTPVQTGDALLNIANALFLLKKYDEAIPPFEKVIALEKALPAHIAQAQHGIGLCLLYQKKNEDALKAFEKVASLKDCPPYFEIEAIRMSGTCYYNLKDNDKAKDAFSKVAANPKASAAQKKTSEDIIKRIDAAAGK